MKRIVGNGGSGGARAGRVAMLRAAGVRGSALSTNGSRRAGNLQPGSRALRGAAAQAPRGGARARARGGR